MTYMLALAFAALLQNPVQTQTPAPATIDGMVVRAGTNEPIGRAQVTVMRVTAPGPGARGAAAAPQTPGAPAAPGTPPGRGAAAPAPPAIPAVTTDAQGRFQIKDLPPGSYRLAAARNGFARQEYGQRSPRNPGTILNLQPGQAMKDVAFTLTPAGTVSGRITDSIGEPLAGVTVQLQRSTYDGQGRRTFQNVVSARTNDLGEYRLYWVTPGTYYLNATASGSYFDTLMQGVLNSAATQAQAQDPNTANATQATLDSLLGVNRNEVVEPGFSLTYYPGTLDGTRATAVDVQPGVELRSMDFSLVRQQMYRIQGRVFDSRTGQVPQTSIVQLAHRQDAGQLPKPASNYDATTGTFEIKDVAPGEYVVVAVVVNVNTSTPAAPTIGAAMTNVDITGSNVENLVLNVKSGVTIPGRVNVEGVSAISSVTGFERMRVRLLPTSPVNVFTAQPPTLSPDGTFAIGEVPAGDYRVGMLGLPANHYVKAARFGGADVLQDAMTISDTVSGGIEILVSPNAGQITGSIVNRDSKPVQAVQAVLIPERQRDRRDLYRTTVSDQGGRFTFLSIPPGDYRIFAWEDIEPFAYNDPEVLRQYEAQAVLVRIAESSRETVEVRIIPARQ